MFRSTLLCLACFWVKCVQETHMMLLFLLRLNEVSVPINMSACLIKHVCLQSRFLSSPDHRALGTGMLCILYLWNPTLQSLFTASAVQGVKEASVLNPIRISFTACWLLGSSWSLVLGFPQVEEHLLSSPRAVHSLQLIQLLNSVAVCATHSPGWQGVSSLHEAAREWLFLMHAFSESRRRRALTSAFPNPQNSWKECLVTFKKDSNRVCQWHLHYLVPT